jgi:hypothetical protein
MTTGALMGYPQTSITTVGNTNGGWFMDNRFGNCYGLDIGDGSISGIRKWDAWPNGSELRARNIADLGVNALYLGQCQTYQSQEMVTGGGASNSDTLNGYALTDLTATSFFGVASSSLANSTPFRILAPYNLCCFQGLFGDIVVANTITATVELNQVSWGRKLNQRTTIAENDSRIGAVPDGSGTNAWAIGFESNSASLYKIVSGANIAIVSGFAPSYIDATWSNITEFAGVSVDQTDGNPIAAFGTTDVVTNKSYIVKFDGTSGAVLWKVPTGNGINYFPFDMGTNVIKNSVLYYLGTDSNQLFTINTKTGAYSTSTFSNAVVDAVHGRQQSEDVSGTVTVGGVTTVGGSLAWYGAWSEGTTHPAYLGSYCLTGGHHSGTQMGWRYWPSGAPNPAPSYGAPAYSRKRAWTFVLDGHTFYVLDLGSQGCWLYDITTDQWCQFITTGYVSWNFANGCMWGQRIVGGDLSTTDVWEMQPGALFDNGAAEIVHVVTGGVATRSRIFHSVDSFYLSCSSGKALDPAGANVTLEMSDDQGNTWVTMDTLPIQQGNFSQEFAWNGLGAFARPGRIFKIIDSGGFLRIDAADAGIDGFDPASDDKGD